MDKQETRKLLIDIIESIPNKADKSLVIRDQLFKLLKGHKVIALFASMPNEVNLDLLIKDLLEDGRVVVLPRMIDKEIEFYQISSLEELNDINNKYQIREPNRKNLYSKQDIEVIVVPGLGFDRDNNRLGHGGGYYDRYLKDYKGQKVGVCFKEQILDRVPHDNHDIRMDLVISDNL